MDCSIYEYTGLTGKIKNLNATIDNIENGDKLSFITKSYLNEWEIKVKIRNITQNKTYILLEDSAFLKGICENIKLTD